MKGGEGGAEGKVLGSFCEVGAGKERGREEKEVFF